MATNKQAALTTILRMHASILPAVFTLIGLGAMDASLTTKATKIISLVCKRSKESFQFIKVIDGVAATLIAAGGL